MRYGLLALDDGTCAEPELAERVAQHAGLPVPVEAFGVDRLVFLRRLDVLAHRRDPVPVDDILRDIDPLASTMT